MLTILPYIPNVTDYDNLAAEMKKRGNLLNHPLLVISEPEHEDAAYLIGAKLADLFSNTKSAVLPDAPRRPVQLANDLFLMAVRVSQSLATSPEAQDPAILYYDPQYRPTKTGWLDAIQSEYYLMRAPHIYGASTKDDEGALIFNGPVVLSRKYGRESGLLDFLPENVHWRTHLRWEFTNNSVNTKLIGPGAESVLKLPSKK